MGQQQVLDFLQVRPKERFTAKEIASFCSLNVTYRGVFMSLKRLVKAELVVREAGIDEEGKLRAYYRVK